MISKTCQYALRAVIYIASNQEEGFVSTKQISKDTGISYFFLGKILNKLTHEGYLESYKGPNGGVRLLKPAEDISVLDILSAIENVKCLEGCFLGLPNCSDKNKCSIHDSWKDIKLSIYKMLSEKTIHELTKET
ncbi:Rrf2 family transcriptional regulator [bacterium]|nr:Rrf2 family transcriptional regulator [bacterium]